MPHRNSSWFNLKLSRTAMVGLSGAVLGASWALPVLGFLLVAGVAGVGLWVRLRANHIKDEVSCAQVSCAHYLGDE